ncbi:MAG TPA: ribosome-associated translation inhibitor RaiA [Candidatus Saccharimonadales bacterium]|nr:ribosome-associated translation inhibitor RaiA [Candidatus Saccharimonadales bacterium]
MIQKLEISAVHTTLSPELQKYVTKKIGHLDRFLPRHARASAHAEVTLKELQPKNKRQCVCEVVLYLPKETITTKEGTVNMFAAVDIVEAKLKNQLKKYKDKHTTHRLHRRIIKRLRRR